jgi:hypothetical protein
MERETWMLPGATLTEYCEDESGVAWTGKKEAASEIDNNSIGRNSLIFNWH